MFLNTPYQIFNISSDKVQACALHDGAWGNEGSILCWNYLLDGEAKVLKGRFESIDRKNKPISFRVIEGDVLKGFKCFVYKLQVSPKNLGEGSIVHWILEYEKQHEGIANPDSWLELTVQLSKDVDSHIIQGN